MSTVLIPLAATLAAGVLTWFFCLRPMRRSAGTSGASCCAPAEETIESQIQEARAQLAQLHAAAPATEAFPQPRHEH